MGQLRLQVGECLCPAISKITLDRRPLLSELGALASRRAMTAAALSGVYQHASDLLDRLLLRLVAAWQAAHADGSIAQ